MATVGFIAPAIPSNQVSSSFPFRTPQSAIRPSAPFDARYRNNGFRLGGSHEGLLLIIMTLLCPPRVSNKDTRYGKILTNFQKMMKFNGEVEIEFLSVISPIFSIHRQSLRKQRLCSTLKLIPTPVTLPLNRQFQTLVHGLSID